MFHAQSSLHFRTAHFLNAFPRTVVPTHSLEGSLVDWLNNVLSQKQIAPAPVIIIVVQRSGQIERRAGTPIGNNQDYVKMNENNTWQDTGKE